MKNNETDRPITQMDLFEEYHSISIPRWKQNKILVSIVETPLGKLVSLTNYRILYDPIFEWIN